MTKTLIIESDDDDLDLECTQANPALDDDDECTQRPFVEDAFVLKLFGEYTNQLKDLQEITVSVDENTWSIGRSSFIKSLPAQAKMISRNHFEIKSTIDSSSCYQFKLVCQSSNVTLINDHLVMQGESQQLQKGDKIGILYAKNGTSLRPTLGWEFHPLVPLSEPKFKVPDTLKKKTTDTTKISEPEPKKKIVTETTKKAEDDDQVKKAGILQFLLQQSTQTKKTDKKEEEPIPKKVDDKKKVDADPSQKEAILQQILKTASLDPRFMEKLEHSLEDATTTNKAIGKEKITSPQKNQESKKPNKTTKPIQSPQIKRVELPSSDIVPIKRIQSLDAIEKTTQVESVPITRVSSFENTKRKPTESEPFEPIKKAKSSENTPNNNFVVNKHFSYVGYSDSEVNEHARKKIIDYLTKYGATFTPNLKNSDYVIVHKDFLYDPSKNSDFLACKLNSKTIFLENFSCLDAVCREKNLNKVSTSVVFPKTGGKIVVDSNVSRSLGELEMVFSSVFQAEGVWEVHSKELIHSKQYANNILFSLFLKLFSLIHKRIKVNRIDEQRENDLNSKLYPQALPLLIKHLLCLQRERAKECRHFILVSTDNNLKKIANQYQLLVLGPYDLKTFLNNLKNKNL